MPTDPHRPSCAVREPRADRALLGGLLADAFGVRTAVAVVAGLTAASGLLVSMRMYETLHRPGFAQLQRKKERTC